MLKKILVGLALLVVALTAAVATRPSTFRIERSITIGAPAAIPFSYLNDFHRWPAWSPWEKLDPTMKRTHEGSQAGAGAIYSWVGNDDVGSGKMTLTASKPAERIDIKLEFIRPFTATNATEFTLTPDGEGTKVTWAMSGTNNFMSKAFSLVMDMDKMIGKDFEKGLGSLKQVAEAEAKNASTPTGTRPAP